MPFSVRITNDLVDYFPIILSNISLCVPCCSDCSMTCVSCLVVVAELISVEDLTWTSSCLKETFLVSWTVSVA